jgi:hypothetical protein
VTGPLPTHRPAELPAKDSGAGRNRFRDPFCSRWPKAEDVWVGHVHGRAVTDVDVEGGVVREGICAFRAGSQTLGEQEGPVVIRFYRPWTDRGRW